MQLPGRVDTFVGMSFRRGINGDIPATRALQREKHGRPAGQGLLSPLGKREREGQIF